MTDDQHLQSLGRLLGKYHTLESLLRVFLYHLPGAQSTGAPYGTDIYSLQVGTELASCAITDYDTLGQLIDKYNVQMRQPEIPKIDTTLTDIRDALAHGRVSARGNTDPLRLIKFSKPRQGRVRIVFNEVMSEDWFETQTNRATEAINSVLASLPQAATSESRESKGPGSN